MKEEHIYTKKDIKIINLKWIIFIIVLLIILLISTKVGNNADIVNYVGFAGTISSIILAIVAIIYSYYQSSLNTDSTNRLAEAVSKSEDSMMKLEEYESELDQIGNKFTSGIKEMESSTIKINSAINKIDDNFSLTHSKQNELINMLKSGNNSNDDDDDDEVKNIMNIDFMKNILNKNRSFKLIVKIIYEKYVKKEVFNEREVAIEVANKIFKSQSEVGTGIAAGTTFAVLSLLESNGLIVFDKDEEKNNNKMIIKFNKNIEAYLIEKK